ncbi:MAG: iron donor protein CyaY, partial [Burkholderiales bacterium]|nr:iron donor protein CyaY [Burkholderiales bacterium]
MTESEFITLADAALERIGEAIDVALAASDVDGDWSLNDGILEAQWEDGSKLIVNRHVPNREIWVAARSGGFHFRPRDGAWRDTRSGAELGGEIARLVREQSGLEMPPPKLAACSARGPSPRRARSRPPGSARRHAAPVVGRMPLALWRRSPCCARGPSPRRARCYAGGLLARSVDG